MSELTIPEQALDSAKSLLASHPFLFKDYLSVQFKPMTMFDNDIGCYSDILLPNNKKIAISTFPVGRDIIYHMVTIDTKYGKKRIPYCFDLNSIKSSIKLKYRNIYRNNLTFKFFGDVLETIVLNQSIVPNGSEEISYILYSQKMHTEYNLNAKNSLNFYIFNFLMSNTRLPELLSAGNYFGHFEEFMSSNQSYVELLRMYEI